LAAGLAISLASTLALLAPLPAAAQVTRLIPKTALRGRIAFTSPPAILLDRNAARLSPGVRIHGQDNMLVMTGNVTGAEFVVDFTIEATTGLVNEVWLLTPAEAAVQPWPRNPGEAAAWTFDYLAQTWTKP